MSPPWRLAQHPVYGKVRLVRETSTGPDGNVYEWWSYDPTYEPPLPAAAVRGDVSKQLFCSAHHVPKYFYVDENRQCLQCGRTFTFKAREQKYWYETLKFNFRSVPIRCVTCRQRRRSEHALREQIALAKRATSQSRTDPAAHLALARAIVEYHERTNEGGLDDAIAAARRAASLWPEAAEPALWEGLAHSMAGRPAKARNCLDRFLTTPGVDRKRSSLVERARRCLENLR